MKKIVLTFLCICFYTKFIFAVPIFKISKVFFYALSSSEINEYVQVYCVNDGNNGNGTDINKYSFYYCKKDEDWQLLKTIEDTTIIKTSEFLVLNINGSIIEDDTFAKNNLINIYKSSDEDVLSYNPGIIAFTNKVGISNSIDCVIFGDGYTLDSEFIDKINYMKSLGLWDNINRNAIVLPCGKDTRLGFEPKFTYNTAISRYLISDSLANQEFNYLNWYVTDDYKTLGKIPELDFNIKMQIDIKSIYDTPKDRGKNITIEYEKYVGTDFYCYNIYVCTQSINIVNTSLKPTIIKTNREDIQATVTVMDLENTDDYILLENNTDYYVLVTVTNKYGIEYRNNIFIKYTSPKINLFNKLKLRITEVLPKGYDDLEDIVEIYCEDDGNNGNGMNLAGYSIGISDNVKYILTSKAQFRGVFKVFENTIIKTGDFCVVECKKNFKDDFYTGTKILRAYSNVYKSAATQVTLGDAQDIIVLYEPDGTGIDCLTYTKDNELYSTKIDALTAVFDNKIWNAGDIEGMVDISKFQNNMSIQRIDKTGLNCFSKSDWKLTRKISVSQDNDSQKINSVYGNLKFLNRVFLVDGSDISRSKLGISFETYSPAIINVRVYDVQGRLLDKIVDKETLSLPGEYLYEWDGKCDNKVVPTGIYIIWIDFFSNTGSFHKTVKKTVVAARKM